MNAHKMLSPGKVRCRAELDDRKDEKYSLGISWAEMKVSIIQMYQYAYLI